MTSTRVATPEVSLDQKECSVKSVDSNIDIEYLFPTELDNSTIGKVGNPIKILSAINLKNFAPIKNQHVPFSSADQVTSSNSPCTVISLTTPSTNDKSVDNLCSVFSVRDAPKDAPLEMLEESSRECSEGNGKNLGESVDTEKNIITQQLAPESKKWT